MRADRRAALLETCGRRGVSLEIATREAEPEGGSAGASYRPLKRVIRQGDPPCLAAPEGVEV
jgi:hypothetical protein